jgi:hypothetical protein
VNYEALQDAVLLEGNYGEVERPLVKSVLNRARKDVAGRWRWPWLEKTGTITTTPLSATVALPTDLAFFGRLTDASDELAPVFVDMHDPRMLAVTREDQSAEYGVPMYYTVYEGSLWFMPIPDEALTYGIRYWKQFTTDMSDDADEHGLPLADEDVLIHGALYFMAMRDRNAQLTSLRQDTYEGKLRQMIANAKLRQSDVPRRAAMPDHYGGIYDDA